MKKPTIPLYGKGSAITDQESLKRRAKSKQITQVTMLHLVDVARERGAKDRVQGYWNTYHCQNNLIVADGRIRAPLCRNRFCPYCCGVRKAELINKYLPEIRLWKDAHFVTLTRLAVPATALPEAIDEMQTVFSQINARLKKRWQRGTGIEIIGLRALECNFNATLNTYNPHFHILVPSSEVAFTLLGQWFNAWQKHEASPYAQDVRPVENPEEDLIELIKYETKIFTDPEPGRGKKKKHTYKIYIRPLDTIYAAMKGQRLVERIGLKLPRVKKEKQQTRLVDDYEIWPYHFPSGNWLHPEYEGVLINYEPSYELRHILDNHIDTETG